MDGTDKGAGTILEGSDRADIVAKHTAAAAGTQPRRRRLAAKTVEQREREQRRMARARLAREENRPDLGKLTTDDRARLELRRAQRRLAAEPEAPITLVTLPGVQPLSAMTRFIEGGRDRIIEFIQLAMLNNDLAASQWWRLYQSLPTYARKIVSFDDVCAASGTKPKDLLMAIVSTAIDYSVDVGNLVAASIHPKIVERLAASAERIDGAFADVAQRDRVHFLQARGFLPAPKGTVVNVTASASAQAAAAASSEPSVPKFIDDMHAVGRSRTAAATPALPAPDPSLSFSFLDAAVTARDGVAVPVPPAGPNSDEQD